MSRHNRNRFIIPLALMVLATGLGACAAWRRRAGPYQRVTEEPQLSVYLHRTGARENMPLEVYLKGVVAGEMENDWPLEALKAQAILARTFTMEQLQRRGGTRELTGTDVSTDETQFQAYDATRINDAVRQAVAATRGQLMTNPRGEPVRAWYHADAGGKTATAEEGLAYRDAPTPHLQVVEAPSANPEAAWTESFEPAEFLAAVRQAAPGAQVAAVTTVTISRRGPSGRATELLVGRVRVPAVALRMALDPRRMRSTMLTAVSVQPGGRVTMSGRGAGHGVGLPQWSARYYAERGETAAQILERFFRGVKVETWWR